MKYYFPVLQPTQSDAFSCFQDAREKIIRLEGDLRLLVGVLKAAPVRFIEERLPMARAGKAELYVSEKLSHSLLYREVTLCFFCLICKANMT